MNLRLRLGRVGLSVALQDAGWTLQVRHGRHELLFLSGAGPSRPRTVRPTPDAIRAAYRDGQADCEADHDAVIEAAISAHLSDAPSIRPARALALVRDTAGGAS